MLRDMYTRTMPVVSIAAQIAAADVTGAVVDLQGYGAATVLLEIGAGGITFSGTNKVEFILQEGDASDGSDMAAVAQAAVIPSSITVTSGIVKSLVAAHASGEAFRVGYVGSKRYIRLIADFSGTHGTGTPIAATVLCQRPDNAPV
jgi:hypothetical protein